MQKEMERELGIEITLLERFTEQRLPRILAIRDHVVEGNRLGDEEIAFLEEVLETCRQIAGTVQQYPKYADIYNRAIELYSEITRLALENETGRTPSM